MSFDIKIQTNKSEKNKLTKSITDIVTLNGTLKSGTSIVDPVILIEYDLETTGYLNANYCTIAKFGRSYFINDIVSVRKGLTEIHAHVDVLSSFAAQIKANTAIIHKQEHEWNLYLNDGTFKVYQNPKIVTQPFPSGFSTLEYVLAVAGH